MPEKHDLLAAILATNKRQGIGAILAFAMAFLRGEYNGGAFKNSNRRNVCAVSPWLTRPSRLRQFNNNLAYITSVFIGYVTTARLVRRKRFAAKKAGVEDGRNQ